MIDTSETLLDRLKAENAHDAWQDFFQQYWGAVLRYGRKLGLSFPEAEDVLQETMVALMRELPRFAYDRRKGRFRNFLLTIVHRKAAKRWHERQRENRLEGDAAPLLAPATHEPDLDEASLQRWRESIFEEALRRVRSDSKIDGNTFAVFEAYVVHQQPVAEVAACYGLEPNAIYQVKSRLLKRVRSEVRRLERDSGMEDRD
jgi:RNA polymerase sigma factor (sigma-70 family)